MGVSCENLLVYISTILRIDHFISEFWSSFNRKQFFLSLDDTKKGAGLSGYQEVDPLAAGKPYSEIYAQQAAQKIKSLNANWYYTWGIDPLTKVDSTVEFVPMIWTVDDTGKWLPSEIFKRLREQVNANNKKFRRLLLYNEPNGGNQAHMTPGTNKRRSK